MIAVLQNMASSASVGLAGPGQTGAGIDPAFTPGDDRFSEVLRQANMPLRPVAHDGLPDLPDAPIEIAIAAVTVPFFPAAPFIPSIATESFFAATPILDVLGQGAVSDGLLGDMTASSADQPIVDHPVLANPGLQTPAAVATNLTLSHVARTGREGTMLPDAGPATPDHEMAARGADRGVVVPDSPPGSVGPALLLTPPPQAFGDIAPKVEDGNSSNDISPKTTSITAVPDASQPMAPAPGDAWPKANATPDHPAADTAALPPAIPLTADKGPQVSMAETLWRQKLNADGSGVVPASNAGAQPLLPTPNFAGPLPDWVSGALTQSPDTTTDAGNDLAVPIIYAGPKAAPAQIGADVTKPADAVEQDTTATGTRTQSAPAQIPTDTANPQTVETGALLPLSPLAPSALALSGAASPLGSPAPVAVNNLAPAIVEMSRLGNDGPIELALAPEELGRLTISLRQEGDFVRVSMIAERPETLDLLRRHAGDLLADLRQSGFSGASFSFGQSGQDQTPQFGPGRPDADGIVPAQPAPDFKHPPHIRPHQGAGLDLRF